MDEDFTRVGLLGLLDAATVDPDGDEGDGDADAEGSAKLLPSPLTGPPPLLGAGTRL